MLKKFDLMGLSPEISICGRSTYQSYTGFILTVLFIILAVLAFAAFGRDIFENKEATTQYNRDTDPNPYHLLDRNFTIMFAVADNNIIPFTDVLRKFHFYVQTGNTNSSRQIDENTPTLQYTSYDMVPCTSVYVNPAALPSTVLELQHYWCFRN